MANGQTVEDAMNFEGPLTKGKLGEEGFWIDSEGIPLPVSASDLAFLNASNLIFKDLTVGIHIITFKPCVAAHSIDLIPSTTW